MTSLPPGWYPDPTPPRGKAPRPRWYDGERWTYQYGPAPEEAGGPGRTPVGATLAGWWVRLGAYLIDGLIVYVASIFLSLAFLGPVDWELVIWTWTFFVVSLGVSVLYEACFLRWKRATPGKLALGLRVQLRERSGSMAWHVILRRSIGKNLGYILGLVPYVGGLLAFAWWINFLWPLWDDKNQALHDKAAGTNVVKFR